MRDWKNRHDPAGMENAGVEISARNCGVENAGVERSGVNDNIESEQK